MAVLMWKQELALIISLKFFGLTWFGVLPPSLLRNQAHRRQRFKIPTTILEYLEAFAFNCKKPYGITQPNILFLVEILFDAIASRKIFNCFSFTSFSAIKICSAARPPFKFDKGAF